METLPARVVLLIGCATVLFICLLYLSLGSVEPYSGTTSCNSLTVPTEFHGDTIPDPNQCPPESRQ